jgi:Plasmid pRiA4b ORF-3-like protein.
MYMLETVRPTPELVAKGRALADSALFGCLFPASDTAYAFCEAHWDKRRKNIRASDIPAFLQEVMPQERERLLHRMAVNLEVEALAGRAGRKENQTAARLWLGMKENVAPFWTIPFVQELADLSIDTIVADLRRGFKNQREAFAASERESENPEAVFTGLMRQLFEGADPDNIPVPDFFGMTPPRSAKPRGKTKAKKDAPSGAKKAEAAKKRNIYRLSVDVRGYPPPLDDFMRAHPGIVREIEIGGDQTLDKLHLTIFRAFERDDMHAYEFQLSDKPMESGAPRYTHPDIMDDASDGLVHNAATTTLDQLDLAVGQTFLYWFDFGDDWWHGITVKEIGSPAPRSRYPRVVAKHGFSPPQYPEM